MYCGNCGKTMDDFRDDAHFCTGKCKASSYRRKGGEHVHEDLEREHTKYCEFCGNRFTYNDYAKRGGKRPPTYCCDKCRVNAWRARKADEARRDDNAKTYTNSWDAHAKRERERVEQERARAEEESKAKQKARSERPEGFRAQYFAQPPKRWNSVDAYNWLKVPFESTEAQCKASWRKINQQLHADTNGGADSEILKHVNAAYDWLKRNVWKKR